MLVVLIVLIVIIIAFIVSATRYDTPSYQHPFTGDCDQCQIRWPNGLQPPKHIKDLPTSNLLNKPPFTICIKHDTPQTKRQYMTFKYYINITERELAFINDQTFLHTYSSQQRLPVDKVFAQFPASSFQFPVSSFQFISGLQTIDGYVVSILPLPSEMATTNGSINSANMTSFTWSRLDTNVLRLDYCGRKEFQMP